MEINLENALNNACFDGIRLHIARYLMANSSHRLDGYEKAQRHLAMCDFYVSVATGSEKGSDHFNDELASKIHDETRKLTDHMDATIGFPINGRPDIDALVPLFFEKFHALALQAIARF